MTKWISILLVLLAGCGPHDYTPVSNEEQMQIICLNGIVYYQFRGGGVYTGYGYMSPKFNSDGSVATCQQ